MVDSNRSPFDVTCKHCSMTYTIIADGDDIVTWREGGGYIQDVLSYLSAAERELLISGTCDNCWNLMFGVGPEESEEEEESCSEESPVEEDTSCNPNCSPSATWCGGCGGHDTVKIDVQAELAKSKPIIDRVLSGDISLERRSEIERVWLEYESELNNIVAKFGDGEGVSDLYRELAHAEFSFIKSLGMIEPDVYKRGNTINLRDFTDGIGILLSNKEREAIGVAIQCVESSRAQRHPEEEEARCMLENVGLTLQYLLDRSK